MIVGLAQSSGIGGGSILTPILMATFNYTPKEAVCVTILLIFGGSLGNFMNNYSLTNSQS